MNPYRGILAWMRGVNPGQAQRVAGSNPMILAEKTVSAER